MDKKPLPLIIQEKLIKSTALILILIGQIMSLCIVYKFMFDIPDIQVRNISYLIFVLACPCIWSLIYNLFGNKILKLAIWMESNLFKNTNSKNWNIIRFNKSWKLKYNDAA